MSRTRLEPAGTLDSVPLTNDAAKYTGVGNGTSFVADSERNVARTVLSCSKANDSFALLDAVPYSTLGAWTVNFWMKSLDTSGVDYQYLYTHLSPAAAASLNYWGPNQIKIYFPEDANPGESSGVFRVIVKDSEDRVDRGHPARAASFLDSDGYVGSQRGAPSLGSTLLDPAGNPVSGGDWQMLTVTGGEGSLAGFKLYVDGNLLAYWLQPIVDTDGVTHPVNGGGPLDLTEPISLCNRFTGGLDRAFNGLMSDLTIFDDALSASDVAALAQVDPDTTADFFQAVQNAPVLDLSPIFAPDTAGDNPPNASVAIPAGAPAIPVPAAYFPLDGSLQSDTSTGGGSFGGAAVPNASFTTQFAADPTGHAGTVLACSKVADPTTSSNQYLFSHGSQAANAAFIQDGYPYASNQALLNDTDDELAKRAAVQQDLEDGYWHMLTVTTNPDTSPGFCMYLDGNQTACEVANGTYIDADGNVVPVDGGHPMILDAPIFLCSPSFPSPERGFDGYLSQLALFDTALDPAQVQAIYQYPGSSPLLCRHRLLRTVAAAAMGKRKANEQASASPARELSAEPQAAAAGNGSAGQAAAKTKPARRKKAEAAPAGPVYSAALRPEQYEGEAFRIVSWNVCSLRTLLAKNDGALKALVESENADVLCLQETKLQDKGLEIIEAKLGLEGWHCHWNCSSGRKGYSGTAILTRTKPLSIHCDLGHDDHDQEGRLVTAEFPGFYVVNVYVPNAGDGLKRLDYRLQSWDRDFSAYLQKLQQTKPVILTGDLNTAHQAIDIHSPKTNLRSPGFTQEERDSFTANLIDKGLVDAFRHQHPGVTAYTYWNYRFNCRANNKGWRLDYFLVPPAILERVHDCYHLAEVLGSDHCPIGIVVKS
ncbi:hypothetical protein WJX72_004249 [[Myrmecia] bisecta]|uniref:Endonuclease/exonuclease/phosphatase domain-containing protein n=1 Tax=[Myrmecia] bisecta TaxID=41462 RepID=A0AAW1Q316_9CHLO